MKWNSELKLEIMYRSSVGGGSSSADAGSI